MGQPKALLDWRGRPAVLHAVEVVREGCRRRAGLRRSRPRPAVAAARCDRCRRRRCPSWAARRAACRPRGTRRAGRGRVRLWRGHAAARAGVRPSGLRVAAGRRRRRRARDRGSRAAAARGLPDGDCRRRSRSCSAHGHLGLKDIPAVCAVRELSERELLADAELRAVDPELLLCCEREHAGGMGGLSPRRRRQVLPHRRRGFASRLRDHQSASASQGRVSVA